MTQFSLAFAQEQKIREQARGDAHFYNVLLVKQVSASRVIVELEQTNLQIFACAENVWKFVATQRSNFTEQYVL